MSIICKFRKQIKEHFIDNEGQGSLETLLKEAGANEQTAKDVAKSVKYKYAGMVDKDVKKLISKLEAEKPINFKSEEKWKQTLKTLETSLRNGEVDQARIKSSLQQGYGIPTLTPEQAKKLSGYAQEIQKLKPESIERKTKELLLQQMIAELPSSQNKAVFGTFKTGEAFLEKYPVINLLLDVKQIIKQAGGNFSESAYRTIERQLENSLDKIASKWTGQRTSVFDLVDKSRGGLYTKSLKEGVERGYKEGILGINTENMDFSKKMFRGTWLEHAENQVDGLLGSFDRGFMALSRTESMLNQLLANKIKLPELKSPKAVEEYFRAIDEGKVKGIDQKRWDEIKLQATQEALETGFRDETVLAKISQHFRKTPIVGTLLNRFATIPMNIQARRIERIPVVGLAPAAFKTWKYLNKYSKGEISKYMLQRELVKAIARPLTSILGTGTLGVGLANMGLIVPQDPSNKYMEGRYAIKMGNYAVNLGFVSNMMSPVLASKEFSTILKDPEKYLNWATKEVASGLMDSPTMVYLRDVFKEEMGEEKSIGEKAMSMIANMATPFIPFSLGIIKPFTKMIDNKIRDTYDSNTAWQSAKRVASNTPLGLLLPVKHDRLGNELNYMEETTPVIDWAFRLGNALINPAFVKKIDTDPILKEANRLYEETGKETAKMRYAGKSDVIKTEEGEEVKVKFTAETRQKLQKETGESMNRILSNVIGSYAYEDLSDEGKAELLRKTISASYKASKVKILGDTVSSSSPDRKLVNAILNEEYESIEKDLVRKVKNSKKEGKMQGKTEKRKVTI